MFLEYILDSSTFHSEILTSLEENEELFGFIEDSYGSTGTYYPQLNVTDQVFSDKANFTLDLS